MTTLPRAELGSTGVSVARLGYGAMELRNRGVSSQDAARLLHAALDGGIDFIDTSPDYGASEERIGEHLSSRRHQFTLASKCGCPIGPVAPGAGRPPHDYRRANVRAGVEQSLRRMRTDHLDLVQFHGNPSRSVLEAEESVDELLALQIEGKIRFIGISSQLPNLADHLAMDVFDTFQIPYSALELSHERAVADAASRGAGTIIRGGVAQGSVAVDPDSLEALPDAARRRVERWQAAGLDEVADRVLDGGDGIELLVRFALGNSNVSTVIVGTADPAHLDHNLAAAAKGPLSPEVCDEVRRRLDGRPDGRHRASTTGRGAASDAGSTRGAARRVLDRIRRGKSR